MHMKTATKLSKLAHTDAKSSAQAEAKSRGPRIVLNRLSSGSKPSKNIKGDSGPPWGPPSRMMIRMSLACFQLRKSVLGRNKSKKKRNSPPHIPERLMQ
eukprot:1422913-Amphidinium_carterae.1